MTLIIRTGVFLSLVLFITACGGGGETTTTLSGTAFNGAMAGGTVTLKDFSGAVLGTTSSDADGKFTLNVAENSLNNGYTVSITSGMKDGGAFTGTLTATYSSTDAKDAANLTVLTSLIDMLAVDLPGNTLEKRDAAIQKLATLGMLQITDWNLLTSDYFDLQALVLRVQDAGGVQAWLDRINTDIEDGELSLAESSTLFPKAHGGIQTIRVEMSKDSLFPGEATVASFSVDALADGKTPVLKIVQAPAWVTVDGASVKVEPPIGAEVGESLIVVEVAPDSSITGRRATIAAHILKRVLLLNGSLGPDGGKIENDWRNISVVTPAGALSQTYEMSYFLGYDDHGVLRLSWAVTPDMSGSEKSLLKVIQPSIDIIRSQYIEVLETSTKSAARLMRKATSNTPSTPTFTGYLNPACLEQWQKHAVDSENNYQDGFQFTHIWKNTVGQFSLDEPGMSGPGILTRPRIMPSREDRFIKETDFRCASMLLSESETSVESDSELIPVLLVHGYADGIMGEIDNYFSDFPKLLKAQGYTPFIFSWHTENTQIICRF